MEDILNNIIGSLGGFGGGGSGRRGSSAGSKSSGSFSGMLNPTTILNAVTLNILKQLQAELGEAIKRVEKASGIGSTGFDPYSILGVTVHSSKEDVDKAYRKKAKGAHPDAGGNADYMRMINLARDIIYKVNGWGSK